MAKMRKSNAVTGEKRTVVEARPYIQISIACKHHLTAHHSSTATCLPVIPLTTSKALHRRPYTLTDCTHSLVFCPVLQLYHTPVALEPIALVSAERLEPCEMPAVNKVLPVRPCGPAPPPSSQKPGEPKVPRAAVTTAVEDLAASGADAAINAGLFQVRPDRKGGIFY